MNDLSRFSVSVEKSLIERFDQQIEEQGCPTRSKAVADLMRASLVDRQWADGEEVAAAIVLVYDHHKHRLSSQLMHVQHDHHELIVSTQHIHLDHDNCLEIVVVRGRSIEVENLSQKMKAIKGIKYCSLASAATGRDF